MITVGLIRNGATYLSHHLRKNDYWAEVLRQRREPDQQFSRLLASDRIGEAFHYADRRGLFREAGDDEAMFAQAAEHYAENREKGVETMVVIPFW